MKASSHLIAAIIHDGQPLNALNLAILLPLSL